MAEIDAAIPVKQRAFELGKAHATAQDASFAAADGPEKEAASQAEAEAEDAWRNMLRQLDAVALTVAHAPFSDLDDVVARAEAFAELVGRVGDGDTPNAEEDHVLMLASYRAAVVEMIERRPSRGDWDDAVAGLHEIERQIAGWEENGIAERRAKAHRDRDAAITDLFSMQPPHLDGLLLMLDLVREVRFLGRRTYGNRAATIGSEQVTAQALRDESDDGLVEALALIAEHAARLRDLEMPRDWRHVMRDWGNCHPGAKDTIRQAFDLGMHKPNLVSVQIAGRPEHELPILHFNGQSVGPGGLL